MTVSPLPSFPILEAANDTAIERFEMYDDLPQPITSLREADEPKTETTEDILKTLHEALEESEKYSNPYFLAKQTTRPTGHCLPKFSQGFAEISPFGTPFVSPATEQNYLVSHQIPPLQTIPSHPNLPPALQSHDSHSNLTSFIPSIHPSQVTSAQHINFINSLSHAERKIFQQYSTTFIKGHESRLSRLIGKKVKIRRKASGKRFRDPQSGLNIIRAATCVACYKQKKKCVRFGSENCVRCIKRNVACVPRLDKRCQKILQQKM